jgi:hypothetical protein
MLGHIRVIADCPSGISIAVLIMPDWGKSKVSIVRWRPVVGRTRLGMTSKVWLIIGAKCERRSMMGIVAQIIY